MKNIVKLLVFLVLLAIAYTYGRPWFEELGRRIGLGSAASGSDAQRCASFAGSTIREFSEKAEKWGDPPIQVDRWSGSYRLLQGRLQDAYDECGCEARSCRATDEVLDQLGRLMEETNRHYRERREFDYGPGLERVMTAADEARRLADEGY